MLRKHTFPYIRVTGVSLSLQTQLSIRCCKEAIWGICETRIDIGIPVAALSRQVGAVGRSQWSSGKSEPKPGGRTITMLCWRGLSLF